MTNKAHRSNHVPVLLSEVIKYLNPQSNQNFIDATVGDGGHALEILKLISPSGRVLGIDWDETAIEDLEKGLMGSREEGGIMGSGLDTGSNAWEAEPPRTYARSGIEPRSYQVKNLRSRLVLKQGNFARIKNIFSRSDLKGVSGVLLDLGLRTGELEDASRGFSFMKNGPLDMRFYQSGTSIGGITAKEIVNTWSENDLETIFREYGEEKNYKKIARAVVSARQKSAITTTAELAEIVNKTDRSYKSRYTKARIFQALRMAVNGELENLEAGLAGAWEILDGGGRLAVISFHSLEDRVVKNFFKEKQAFGAGRILTQKPIVPGPAEIKNNPKSRSAKLRAIIKL